MATQVQQTKTILESLRAKEKERIWLRNRTMGDIDERKLVDGLVGETAIYKQRGEAQEGRAIISLISHPSFPVSRLLSLISHLALSSLSSLS